MIKYLKRKLAEWVKEANYDIKDVPENYKLVSGIQTNDVLSNELPELGMIRFELFPAIGGRILKVNRLTEDVRKGVERHVDMYIITDSDDIGERVAKIVNLQMYK